MAEPHNNSLTSTIATSLHVEQLDTNLFRSTSLTIPYRARGVFGGQVISQAVVSATNCVSPEFALHSLHCYFLLSASPAVPILYYVERLREGRSYCTRSVKAVQNGKIIFFLVCSYQRPEPWQPAHQLAMPAGVPGPDECEYEEDSLRRLANSPDTSDRLRSIFREFAVERENSPIAVKKVQVRKMEDGSRMFMYWMRAKDIPKYPAPFQKCIVGYISDLYFIGVAGNTLGLKRYSKGPDALGMMSSLDHSIHFYDDDFHCGDWLLYAIISPRAGSGRGISTGRMYTESGKLIAVMTQEGVVRADRRNPEGEPKSKL